jgi:hypothetical protein
MFGRESIWDFQEKSSQNGGSRKNAASPGYGDKKKGRKNRPGQAGVEGLDLPGRIAEAVKTTHFDTHPVEFADAYFFIATKLLLFAQPKLRKYLICVLRFSKNSEKFEL